VRCGFFRFKSNPSLQFSLISQDPAWKLRDQRHVEFACPGRLAVLAVFVI
jgi:hypothetical protein